MDLLVNIYKHPKTTSGCWLYVPVHYFHPFQMLKWRKNYGAIFEPLFTKLKPTTYQSQPLSQWLSQS